MSEGVFADLDTGLPLMLLPVRLEARYLPRGTPSHLHVRIFPDAIHADGHTVNLTEREEYTGQKYWTSIWAVADEAVISESRRWLAGRTGPYRAPYVAKLTTPTNLHSGDAAPAFPAVATVLAPEPTKARLLPDEWMVRLYDADLTLVYTGFTKPVAEDLAMAPALGAVDFGARDKSGKVRAPLDAFLQDQALDWIVDFDPAVEAGMALKIPITEVPDPVGTLLVTGVRGGRAAIEEGDELDALLKAHRYTRGFDFVPQGTPTNNTDAGRSGISVDNPDVDALFDLEENERVIPPLGRAILMALDSAFMYRVPCADSASLALGRLVRNAFDRTAHADWGEGAGAWAMNVAIGYATLGDYLGGPLAMVDGRTALGEDTGTFRDWYVDWVRSSGPLPTLRCGEQPYGLLPITHAPEIYWGMAEFRVKLEHCLNQFMETWRNAFPVAALDPEATDGTPYASESGDALTVAQVLGAVPHPRELQLRVATDHLEEDTERFWELVDQLEALVHADNLEDPDYVADGEDSLINVYWNNRKQYIIGQPDESPPVLPPSIGSQLGNLDLFKQEVEHADDLEDRFTLARDIVALIDSDIMPLLEMHNEATQAVPSDLLQWNEGGGVGAGNVIRLVGTTYDEGVETVPDLVTAEDDLQDVKDCLTDAIEELQKVIDNGVPKGQRTPLIDSPAPLLLHFLNQNYLDVPFDTAGSVKVAFQALEFMINSPMVPDPHGELERLFRESLGLAMYRLDAWITSLASERLASKRRTRPSGLQIGGYGWLLDLKKSDDPTSQGFIHAPSMTHAATAAVLRSGWSAFGTDSGETPLSIDLSSNRVRGGQWILDGVRNGQDLAELLGARFERYLHDAHVDDWIATVRQMVLDLRGRKLPPNEMVDGLIVARAGSDLDRTASEDELRTELLAATELGVVPSEDAARSAVREAVKTLAADLDSVADLIMAQSVHALVQGTGEMASATLAVTGSSDGAVPPITVTNTQRDAQLISHRVVAMWPETTSPAPQASPLELAEPRLVPWIESLLPDPAAVVAQVTVLDADGLVVENVRLTLATVGLTAMEAAVLAGASESQVTSRLGRLFAAGAAAQVQDGQSAVVDLGGGEARRDGEVSVDEFGLMGNVAMDAVGRSRALQPEDLLLPGSAVPEAQYDLDGLEGRVVAVEAGLGNVLDDLGSNDPATVMRGLVRSAALDVPGAVVAIEAGADPAAVGSVITAIEERLNPPADASAEKRSFRLRRAPIRMVTAGEGQVAKPSGDPGDTDETPAPNPFDVVLERLGTLIANRVPVLPVFTPGSDADRARSASSTKRQREVASYGHTWLRQVGRVRTAVGAMNEFTLLSETVLGRTPGSYGLAQLPHQNEGWAAVTDPVGQKERLCIVVLTGRGLLAADETAMAGLLIDGWTEGIPRSDQLTGIAVHFDAPTARAPNAVLLSVVEDDRGFSADEVTDQLLHTIELAKIRAVGPTDIEEHGHYLPTVFLPDDVVVSGGEE